MKDANVVEQQTQDTQNVPPTKREGATPSVGTGDDLISRSELNKHIDNQLEAVAKRGLMYGGDLNGVEAVWVTLMFIKYHINDVNDEGWRQAYGRVAQKYKCGSALISSKLAREMSQTSEASVELARRLREVDKAFEVQLQNERTRPLPAA